MPDVVITTAKVFGQKAPVMVTEEMLEGMKEGSVVVDLAVETGGNVEGSQLGREIEGNGVTIIGLRELPGRVPGTASQMFSSNLGHLHRTFLEQEGRALVLEPE